jgi:hypothetical protein
LAHKTYPCQLPTLEFVRLFGDVSITAAYSCHLGGLPGAFRAAYYLHLGDLPGASAAAGFTGLTSASASASASAHRASSPSWVNNDGGTTVPPGDELVQSPRHCPARFGLSSVSYSLEKKHHFKILTRLDWGEAGYAPTRWTGSFRESVSTGLRSRGLIGGSKSPTTSQSLEVHAAFLLP